MGERALADIQQFMTAALQRAAPLGPDLAPKVEALVLPSSRGMAPSARLDVYREQFWQRHLRNLAEDYPTLTWAVGGPAAFAEVAREFLLASPPHTWDLQRLGAGVPRFVASHDRWSEDATACDAASLDWAFMEIFDAPDAAPFDARVLAATPEDAWPGARVVGHPAMRLVPLRSALLDVRNAITAASEDATAVARPAANPTWVIVWRDRAFYPQSTAIEAPAFALLTRLVRGEPLGAACEVVASEHRGEVDVEASVGSWFEDWVRRGWVVQVIVSPST